MHLRLCFLLALSACTALRADIYLRAALQCNGRYVVALWNSRERHKSVEWVPVGGTFAEFTVESYDLARDCVRLRKDDTIVEATLSTPAPVEPRLFTSRNVLIEEGRRLCPLHREPLTVTRGFLPENGCLRSSIAYVLAAAKFRAECPNAGGWMTTPEPTPSRTDEVRNEYCALCEKVLVERVAAMQAKAAPR